MDLKICNKYFFICLIDFIPDFRDDPDFEKMFLQWT